MRSNSTNPKAGLSPTASRAPESVRKPFLLLVGVAGIILVSVIVRVSTHGSIDFTRANAPISQKQATLEASAFAGKAPSNGSFSNPLEGAFNSDRDTQSESNKRTIELIEALAQVGSRRSELTPEEADQWKRNLEQLIEQGKAAVPVLDEFFQSNGDVRLDSIPGGKLLGEPTLRIAFLKTLFDIPTPDNVELQERVLQTTKDPAEIALLARQLELQEPGEYRETIIQAVSTALAQGGQVPNRDTSPLIKLLADYGVKTVK
jgi:hypothetical protein